MPCSTLQCDGLICRFPHPPEPWILTSPFPQEARLDLPSIFTSDLLLLKDGTPYSSMSAITEPDATPSAIEDKPLSKTSPFDLPTRWHSEFTYLVVLLDDFSDLLLQGAFATKSQDPEL